jgi:tetratricopeptide (TPR) repeat protein
VPFLRDVGSASLQVLSRGAGAELALLFPALRTDDTPVRTGDAAELKPRLFDAFSHLIGNLAKKSPMLIVLENLHWADPSSLDLFHFVARGVASHPIMLVATYNDAHRDTQRSIKLVEQSLTSLGVLTRQVLPPLTREETSRLIEQGYGETASALGDFPDRVHSRTRGNPFFIEETLKALINSGRLKREGDRWVGWATEQLALPDSIRDALSLRYDRLSEEAKTVEQLAAVVGAQVPHALLERLTRMEPAALLTAIDDLRRERVFEETDGSGGPAYVFTHPMLQEMLYAELGKARQRAMHAQIADALEAMRGTDALAHAEEIAIHFRLAESEAQSERAVRYLVRAGEIAVTRGAHREAAESLSAALALLDHAGDAAASESVLESLGRAKHRLGDYAGAIAHFKRAVAMAEARSDDRRVAALERRIGLAWLRRGEFLVALSHHDRGLAAALRAGDKASEASFHLARSSGMMEVGDGAAAERAGRMALEIAEALGEPRLLARVHLSLQALRIWRGPSAAAVEHGQKAIEFARAADDLRTIWQAEWSFGFLAGLTGDSAGTLRHIEAASRIADELRSPVLRLWTAEVSIEYRSGIGDWNEALELAERSIEQAQAFGQRNLLPRLLVWSALVHCGRGEMEEAKQKIDLAWERSGADRADDGTPINVHHVVPAHVGLGYYHLYRRDYHAALDVGERGLAIADRTGYTVWAVHRLLPLLAEASLWVRDWDRSEAYGARLRVLADQLGHPLARAWSDACFALQRMLQGCGGS